jgi:hypothetical protein
VGVTLFSKELGKDHRFGSSELNLVFEGLLLGASIHLHAKATSSDPRYAQHEEGFVVSCRKLKASEVSK